MGLKKLAVNYGHSLMELVLAIAIVGTVSSIALPNYARYIANTREKVCRINRQEVLYEYQLYCLSEQEISLSDYLRQTYDGKGPLFCPSDGLLIADGSGETAELACSVHHDVITLKGTVSETSDITDTLPSGDTQELLSSLFEE